MDSLMDDHIDLPVDDVRRLLRAVFREADRKDDLQWAEERGLANELFRALLSLAQAADSDASIEEVSPTGSREVGVAHLAIGRRYHVKLKRVAWQLATGTLPLIVGVVIGAVSPGDVTGSIGAAITALVSNLERLEPNEWLVYLAVRQGAATRSDVVRTLAKRLKKPAVDRLLTALLSKGVLNEEAGRLATVL
jgi:hypothetical protein